MRLMLLEKDRNYQKRFFEEFSKQINTKIELICVFNISELIREFDKNSLIMIHEEFLSELFLSEWMNNPIIFNRGLDRQFLILSEGIIEEESIAVVRSYVNTYHLDAFDIESRFIHKYQRLDHMIYKISDFFLTHDERPRIIQTKMSRLISVYSPTVGRRSNIAAYDVIDHIADQLVSRSHYPDPQLKVLVIDYNCFQINSSQFSLSYLFLAIKRKQPNLTFVLSEIIERKGGIDFLRAPIHMRDIDCLDKVEVTKYIDLMKKGTEYDYIFINLENVHITEHVDLILKHSDNCYVNNEDQEVLERMCNQFPYTWRPLKSASDDIDSYNHSPMKEMGDKK